MKDMTSHRLALTPPPALASPAHHVTNWIYPICEKWELPQADARRLYIRNKETILTALFLLACIYGKNRLFPLNKGTASGRVKTVGLYSLKRIMEK